MRPLYEVERFSDLIGIIYSAGLDPARWQDVTNRLHSESGGISVHIIGYDFRSKTDLGFVTSGYSDESLTSYAEHYCHLNPWAKGWVRRPSGVSSSAQQMCSQEELVNSEFYADWVIPQEDVCAGGGVLFHKDQERMFGFGGNIRRRDEEKLEGKWMQLIDLLKPHLRQAFEMNRVLAGRNLAEIAISQAPPTARCTVLVVNGQGQILYTHNDASAMLEKGVEIQSDPLNRLHFNDADAERKYRRALHALNKEETCHPTVFTIGSASGGRRKCMTFCFRGEAGTASNLGVICGIGEPCLLIAIAPEAEDDALRGKLMLLHGLTPAEADVVLAVADGLSTAEIATRRSSSVWTVRAQIKSAMSKCSARRRLDFLSKIEMARHWRPA